MADFLRSKIKIESVENLGISAMADKILIIAAELGVDLPSDCPLKSLRAYAEINLRKPDLDEPCFKEVLEGSVLFKYPSYLRQKSFNDTLNIIKHQFSPAQAELIIRKHLNNRLFKPKIPDDLHSMIEYARWNYSEHVRIIKRSPNLEKMAEALGLPPYPDRLTKDLRTVWTAASIMALEQKSTHGFYENALAACYEKDEYEAADQKTLLSQALRMALRNKSILYQDPDPMKNSKIASLAQKIESKFPENLAHLALSDILDNMRIWYENPEPTVNELCRKVVESYVIAASTKACSCNTQDCKEPYRWWRSESNETSSDEADDARG